MTNDDASADELAGRHLPAWNVADLPEPKPLGLRNLAGLIGPSIVMCGIQIGGGERLFGPAVTARSGSSLMWIATVAIVCQVFYNIECGRYALYCGEPVFTGFLRTRPGSALWVGVAMLLSIGSLIPGLSTNAAVLIAAMILDHTPTADDNFFFHTAVYLLLGVVAVPILLGGKVYNMLQWVMTRKSSWCWDTVFLSRSSLSAHTVGGTYSAASSNLATCPAPIRRATKSSSTHSRITSMKANGRSWRWAASRYWAHSPVTRVEGA